MDTGLSPEQWRAFGVSLHAVHDSDVAAALRDQLRIEDFTIPSAALVRHMQAVVENTEVESPAATAFAAFWREHAAHQRDGGSSREFRQDAASEVV